MISLIQNTNNKCAVTLNERLSTAGPLFSLSLTNCQSNEIVSNIEAYDYTTKNGRYNTIYINPVITIDEIVVKDNTTVTLKENAAYFVNNLLDVEHGSTLVLPESSLIMLKEGYIAVIDGTMDNTANVIIDAYATDTKYVTFEIPGEEFTYATFLINFQTGYYDYEFANYPNTKILEIGKLLIQDSVGYDPTVYQTTEKTYIYNG